MSNEFVSVSNKGALTLVSTVTSLDGSKKTLKVQEGDFLDGLSYLENGTIKTISGVVKVIKYSVKTQSNQTTTLCAHDTVSDFAKRIVPTYIIMDCSREFNSEVISIPVTNIRDFTSNDLGEMVVSNIVVSNANTVTFLCTTTPVAVVWNGEPYIPTQNDPDVGVYTINVTTMKNHNTMVVLDTTNSSNNTVYGVKPTVIESTKISADYTTCITTLADNYYNKYENQEAEIDDAGYYVEVATGVGDTDTVTICGDAFVADQPVKLSIGKNGFITKPAFKVEDGKLYVAAPLLTILADSTGRLDIEVNGFKVATYINFSTGASALTLEGASVYGGMSGYENTAELLTLPDGTQKVILNRQDGTAAAGWLLHVNGTPVVADTLLLTRSEYSDGSPTKYGMTKAIGSDTITDATYNYYLNGAIVEPNSRSISFKVVDPTEGSIDFIIEINETVGTGDTNVPSGEETETPVTPSNPDEEGGSTENPSGGNDEPSGQEPGTGEGGTESETPSEGDSTPGDSESEAGGENSGTESGNPSEGETGTDDAGSGTGTDQQNPSGDDTVTENPSDTTTDSPETEGGSDTEGQGSVTTEPENKEETPTV